uniref:ABC transporter domain-containing protein n=1 Tax=Salix viminalis TaxID=40686 RepID=A0A6N2L8H8_SALVM
MCMMEESLKEVTGMVLDEVAKLGTEDKKQFMESPYKIVEEDYDYLRRLRKRVDRVGMELPRIEIRFQNLSVKGEAYVGSRALPTLLNTTLNAVEGVAQMAGLSPSKKRTVNILQDVKGIVKPSRMSLLLGPPGSGKTTLLKALAGRLDNDIKVTGKVTYCGHELSEFVPQKTCAYISKHELHYGQMTVRETLYFSGRCMGAGTRDRILSELLRREKEADIKPNPRTSKEAAAMTFQDTSLITDNILKILKLDSCADTMVGDDMIRGISGGEKKRVTTGEMLVGPTRAFVMDEISTGLDSSTTYQIVKFMRKMVHLLDMTSVMSLLQPTPETFELFDDIILLSEGQIVYQGPRDNVLEFFERTGFRCPERKGVADFLQEVTSKKDQERYWFRKNQPYKYVSVPQFVRAFNSFHIGLQLSEHLKVPYDKSRVHPDALVSEKYGISNWELFKACFSREWLLMKRNSIVSIFKIIQITIIAIIAFTTFSKTGGKAGQKNGAANFWGALFFGLTNFIINAMIELTMTVFRLPVFFKQRSSMLYPAWAFGLPICLFSIPVSLIESGIWLLAFFSTYQMTLSLYRFIAVVGRKLLVANILGFLTMVTVIVLGGFIITKDDIELWMRWGYYLSPIMYGQNAISINEFLDNRWGNLTGNPHESTVGKSLLKERGFFTDEYWYWICVGVLLGLSLIFNILFIAALEFLNAPADSKAMIADDDTENVSTRKLPPSSEGKIPQSEYKHSKIPNKQYKKGMVLPFQPISLAFNRVNYYVDMPVEMRKQGTEKHRLQLLKDVSGAFRPGTLTALVGVSGAGKTTLLDVLAGRKIKGYIEGSISISGYPKNQVTFARVSGYCEQIDIHSPFVTVYESLLYSASMRLAADMFIDEVMELVELQPLMNALVGLPRIDGLSTEQRKRLTIAVELVANPSIIFMDEPTSGLDARAAAIVMRAIRHMVDTGRTVVCTIHQPSIDIFETFDELLLMKRGGQVIYAGPLGRNSHKLAVPGVPRIKQGSNPATWMLEISSEAIEAQLQVDFAEVYATSELYRKNQELVKKLSTPRPGSKDLSFPSKYPQSFITQCTACFWKQHKSYWRNSEFNYTRFGVAIIIGILFGLVFWSKGDRIYRRNDLINLLGAAYATVLFLGATNASAVQSVIATERTVFYRERAAGMYSELPYAFAHVAIEIVYVSIQTFLYSLLLYSTIGFEWNVSKFLYFYYFIFMSFTYFSMYGMMIISLTPGPEIAAVVMSFFISFWNLFSGYLISRPLIPVWWRWYYWASPVAWTIYGIFTSQVGDKNTLLEIPESEPVPLKAFVERYLGYDQEFLLPVVIAHVGWVLLFFFIFAYGIKFLNFQRR